MGDKTKSLLVAHISEDEPSDYLFNLNYEGIKTMLRRLGEKTGIKARPTIFGEVLLRRSGRWASVN